LFFDEKEANHMRNPVDDTVLDESGSEADDRSFADQENETAGDDLPEDDVEADDTAPQEKEIDTDDGDAPDGGDDPGDPLDSVPEWRVTAVGQRPQDWIARDLIFGSIYRTRAAARLNRHIREYRESAPDWVSLQLSHLPPPEKQSAIPLLAYLEEWHNFLNTLIDPRDSAEDEDLNADGRPTPRRLRACWPVGALVDWAGEGPAPRRKVCNRPQACPWCYARHILDLYEKLRQGPLRQPRPGRYLVQVSMSLPPRMIEPDAEWLGHAQRRPSFNGHSVLRPKVMAEQRSRLCRDFRRFLTDIGMNDGLLTHRVVSALTGRQEHSFQHEFAALGSIELRTAQDMAEFRRRSGIDGDWVEFATPQVHPDKFSARVLVAALPADHPQALRYLLCGTSVGYPLTDLPLIAHEDALKLKGCRWRVDKVFKVGPWLNDGLPGAFGVTPLFLLDPLQWRSYLQETARLPLYRTFGEWRPAGKNRHRGQDSRPSSRVDDLLPLAQALWPAVKAQAQTGSRGRPAYGDCLKRALESKEEPVSRRELSSLVKILKSWDRSRS
jgi:hypothetical protein